MTMEFRDDPKAERLSLMNKAPRVCNGERDGKQCVHYWALIRGVNATNPEVLRNGEKLRLCTVPADPVDFESRREVPSYCNRYVASERDYDDKFEKFNPMTQDDINQVMGEDVPAPAIDPKTFGSEDADG